MLSRSRKARRGNGDPGNPYVDAIRVFLEAALEIIDAREFERVPARRVSTWLFSLGVIDALAARLALEPRAALSLAVAVFGDFYRLDPVRAATVVGRLNELTADTRWRTTRDAGFEAMGDWLVGVDWNAHARLRELLRAPTSPDVARVASRLTAVEDVAMRDPAHRAPRHRKAAPRQRSASGLVSTR
jgi:hypothetical protein